MNKTTVFSKEAYRKGNSFEIIPEGSLVRSYSDYIIGKALGYDLELQATTYLKTFLNDFDKIKSEDKAKIVAVFDFETTAQHNSYAVSLAVFLYNIETEEIIDTFYEIINPQCKISKKAIEVHKITQDEADECPIFEEFIPQIEELFSQADFFVGQNLIFDLAVLEREFERIDKPNPWSSVPVFDTMKAGKGIVQCFDINHRIKAPNLKELCEHYGLEVEGEFHNAAVDVQQTLEVFRNLLLE